MKQKLYIWGAGGHAKVVADAARLSGLWAICGFVDVFPERYGEIFCGAPILREAEIPAGSRVIVGFGHCARRLALARELQANGFTLVTLIHPAASVSPSAKLAEGVFVGAGAVIDPGCQIGLAAIINNGAIICHDTVIGDGTHVAPGAALAGGIRVGRRAWLGLGCRVIENTSVGDDAMLGAGAVAVNDIPAHTLAIGCPAKVRREIAGQGSVPAEKALESQSEEDRQRDVT